MIPDLHSAASSLLTRSNPSVLRPHFVYHCPREKLSQGRDKHKDTCKQQFIDTKKWKHSMSVNRKMDKEIEAGSYNIENKKELQVTQINVTVSKKLRSNKESKLQKDMYSM